MDLREIFNRATAGYHVDDGGIDETLMKRRSEHRAVLDYGQIYYIQNGQREALWAHNELESRIDFSADGKTIIYVDPSALDTYLRRWMTGPIKPNMLDGSSYDVLSLDEEAAVALIRVTYCR